METGFGTQEAKMRFVATKQGQEPKGKINTGELALEQISTGIDSQTALRQLNVLAGVGGRPKEDDPNFKEFKELEILKQRFVSDLKELIIAKRDDPKAGINPRNIIIFQSRIIELLLSFGNGNLQSQVDRITNSVFSQFNLQDSKDLTRYRNELQGVLSVVEFIKSRSRESLQEDQRRGYFTNAQLDSEHQIDIVEFLYRDLEDGLHLDRMDLVQVKSSPVDAKEEERINRQHQEFYNKFLIGNKKLKLIRAGAEQLENDPRAPEYIKQVEILTDKLEDWYLQFLEIYSASDFSEALEKQAIEDFDKLVSNFFADVIQKKSDLPVEGLYTLSPDQQAYCVKIVFKNIQKNTQDEPNLSLLHDRLSELSDRFQEIILKGLSSRQKIIVTETLPVKEAKSTIWWPTGKLEKLLTKNAK